MDSDDQVLDFQRLLIAIKTCAFESIVCTLDDDLGSAWKRTRMKSLIEIGARASEL